MRNRGAHAKLRGVWGGEPKRQGLVRSEGYQGTFGPGMEDFFNKYIAADIPNPKWRKGHAEENETLQGAAKAVAVFRRRGRIASAARSNRAYKIIRLIERVRQTALPATASD